MRSETVTTIAQLIETEIEYSDAVCDAVKAYAKAKPWRGSLDERKAKMQSFNDAMCKAIGIEDVSVLFGRIDDTSSIDSKYSPRNRTIYMSGRVSVVTYLHLLARALGQEQRDCFAWSLKLFAKHFPISFARRRQVGLFLMM